MTSVWAEHWHIMNSTLHWCGEPFLSAFLNKLGTSWRIWRLLWQFAIFHSLSGIYNVIKVKKYTTWKSVSRHHQPSSSTVISIWVNVAQCCNMRQNVTAYVDKRTLHSTDINCQIRGNLANKDVQTSMLSDWPLFNSLAKQSLIASSCLTSCSADGSERRHSFCSLQPAQLILLRRLFAIACTKLPQYSWAVIWWLLSWKKESGRNNCPEGSNVIYAMWT